MKITGRLAPDSFSRLCSSIPDMPPRSISRTRHSAWLPTSRPRNDSADVYSSTRNPWAFSSRRTLLRMLASFSTIATVRRRFSNLCLSFARVEDVRLVHVTVGLPRYVGYCPKGKRHAHVRCSGLASESRRPVLSAMDTASANERTPSFSMILCRWAFTVLSDVPRA